MNINLKKGNINLKRKLISLILWQMAVLWGQQLSWVSASEHENGLGYENINMTRFLFTCYPYYPMKNYCLLPNYSLLILISCTNINIQLFYCGPYCSQFPRRWYPLCLFKKVSLTRGVTQERVSNSSAVYGLVLWKNDR